MAPLTRPTIITITASIAIVLILGSFPLLLMPSIKRLGDFVPMILGIIITLQFASVIGIWHMKQWGVKWFIVLFFVRSITFIMLNLMSFVFYIHVCYGILSIIVFLRHYKKMDLNL